jgi:hypothetical protein
VVAVTASWWLGAGPVARIVCALPGGARCARLTVEDAVSGVSGLALLGCLLWLLAAMAVAATSFVAARLSPGGPVAGWLECLAVRTCPAVVRRAVALVLGAALSTGTVAAQAAPTTPATPATPAGPGRPAPSSNLPELSQTGLGKAVGKAGSLVRRHDQRGLLDGLALPDRVTGAGAPAVAPAVVLRAQPAETPRNAPAGPAPPKAARAGETPAAVTVRPGDSLWSIAAGLLGPGASDAQVARAWHRIAALNAAQLGPDPDLIHPGTRLSIPDLHHRP